MKNFINNKKKRVYLAIGINPRYPKIKKKKKKKTAAAISPNLVIRSKFHFRRRPHIIERFTRSNGSKEYFSSLSLCQRCRVIPRDRSNKWKYRKLASSLPRGESGRIRSNLLSRPVLDERARGIPIRDIAKCVTLRLIDKRNTRSALNRGPFTLL